MKRLSPTNRTLAAFAWITVACALGALASARVAAADAASAILQAIDVQTLPGQQLQLTMRLSGPAPQPLSFTIDNPARISFDLPNIGLGLPSRRIDVHQAGLDTILAAEGKDRTRLVPLGSLVPGMRAVVVKRALGGTAAASLHPAEACDQIRQAVPAALADRGAVRPPAFPGPVQLEVDVLRPWQAERPLLVPGISLKGSRTLCYQAPGFPAAYQVVVKCTFSNLLLLAYEYHSHRILQKE